VSEPANDAVAPPVVAARSLHARMLASRFVGRGTLLAAFAVASIGCGGHVRPPVGVTVVVDGAGGAQVRQRLGAHAVDGLALRPIAPPEAPAEPPDPAIKAVAAARAAYYADDPSFDACKAALEPIEVPALLGAGKRELAARVLVWRTACAWGELDRSGAGLIAGQLASFGLELPADVGAVTPDVEALLDKAKTAVGGTARVPLVVDGTAGTRVLVDGRPAGCIVPCTTDAVPGDHVVSVIGDGFAPAWRVERVPAAGAVKLAAAPASPELAAAQWRARIDRGFAPGDDVGARLVARAAGDGRVAYVTAGDKLRGVFVVDGVVVARAVRSDGNAAGLVRDLALRGKVLPATPLWKQPNFWIATVIVTGIAVAVTTAIVYQPETDTSVVWGD
jgi:hypothetical protein